MAEIKIAPPKGGHKYSKKELQEIQKQQIAEHEERQRLDSMASEANIQINEWADKTIYDGVLPADFSTHVRNTLSHISDMTLKMPYQAYKDLCSITDGKYTVAQMNNIAQIVGNASAYMLNMDMDTYLLFKEEIQGVLSEVASIIDANMARIKAEVETTYATPVSQVVGEA